MADDKITSASSSDKKISCSFCGKSQEEVKKLINEKRVMYDHNVDQRGYKWSGKSILKNIEMKSLPKYISLNQEKFKKWLD